MNYVNGSVLVPLHSMKTLPKETIQINKCIKTVQINFENCSRMIKIIKRVKSYLASINFDSNEFIYVLKIF